MKCVFLLESIHQVMRAEKILKGKGIEIDLIPVPREISSDCGVAIQLDRGEKERAVSFLREEKLFVVACCVQTDGKWAEETEGESPCMDREILKKT